MSTDGSAERGFLRHTLATVAYRGGKALRGAPEGFGSWKASETTRTPLEILAHVGDLYDWALGLAQGQYVFRETPPGTLEFQVERFFAVLRRFDEVLAGEVPLGFPAEKIFQGPIADSLTHIGQLALLRRLAGSPIKGESYFKAQIEAGRVGPEQTPPKAEFE